MSSNIEQDWSLFHIEAGSGDPVVLLHGLAGDHRAWAPQIEALKPHYRVIAFDNPGSGKSSHVSSATDLAAIARSVLRHLDAIGIDRFHTVGRSMGGGIAQEVALAAPGRVRSLALAGSFTKLDGLGIRLIENMRDFIAKDPDWKRWTRQFSFTFVSTEYFLADEARMTRLENIIADESRDVRSYINLANACLAYNSVGRLRNLSCPLLAMAGRNDPICSPITTQWIADEFPQAKVRYFEKSSHFFLMEEADEANRVILDWLSGSAG